MGSSVYRDYQDRFRREAQLGASIESPHVVRVYDLEPLAAPDGAGSVLVMEYVPGGTLAKRLEQARQGIQHINMSEALAITRDVAKGLSALHSLDVVHRDVKPSNIFFDGEGKARIGDLGLAQVPGGYSQRSDLGSLAERHPGTPAYMSPEQETTTHYLTTASDIFSLGWCCSRCSPCTATASCPGERNWVITWQTCRNSWSSCWNACWKGIRKSA